ncbi:MAG: hypothetical protein PHR20_04815 [Bacteroidales bacterium]|nr:hypothetical protein [Bacteroidales bacterium]
MKSAIIYNSTLPCEIITQIEGIFRGIAFGSSGITVEALSGHPDIFICQVNGKAVCAPNTPRKIIEELQGILPVSFGDTNIGTTMETIPSYNVVISGSFVIHNIKHTDKRILEEVGSRRFINVPQAFTRCSTLPLRGDAFITSDAGIAKVFKAEGIDHLLVSSDGISLRGYKNGFIGGCMGADKGTVYITGKLTKHKNGEQITGYLDEHGYNIKELHEGNLIDSGSLLII